MQPFTLSAASVLSTAALSMTALSTAALSMAALGLAACSEYEVVKHEAADVFYQLQASEVDILLVVDNSCSMAPYQQKLADNFDSFLTYFIEGDVDYRIGVTTTSVQEIEFQQGYTCPQAQLDELPDAGALVDDQIITPQTEDASQVFSDIVNVGICGSGMEMGLEAARLALQGSQASGGSGLLRESAYLSVIFVSDEEDASPLPVNEYLNAFRQIKGQGERAAMYVSGLVVEDTATCDAEQIASGATVGDRYLDVIGQSDGIIGDICGDDFAPIITELSLNSSRLNDTFYLSDLPSAATLVVGVTTDGVLSEPACDSGEWTYELRTENEEKVPVVVFDRAHLPPPNSKITVQYDRGDGDPASFCSGGEE